MPIAGLALLLGISIAWLYGAEIERSASDRELRSSTIADNMLLWHEAAVTWRRAHPGFSGAVPGSGLSLPNWYVVMASWHSQCDGMGSVSTYATAADGIKTGRLAFALAIATSGQINAGLVAGGFVVPSFRSATIPAPNGIPNGAAIIITQVAP